MTSKLTKTQRLTIASAVLADVAAKITAVQAALIAATTYADKLDFSRQLAILQERKTQIQREQDEANALP